MSSRLCLYFRTLLLSRDSLLSLEEYCSFHVRLSKLLLAPHFNLALAKANAQTDWDADMRKSGGGGERLMDCDTFCHSLFETMEMYVLLHDAQQVVFILNKAYALLTQTSTPSASSISYLPASSSTHSPSSQSVVTFLPLASIAAHIPFNAHDRHNVDYNQYAHAASQSLHHLLHDNDIEYTVPLLPPLSVDSLSSSAALKERAVGGLKHGPTRDGLHCSIGAMDEFITLYSPYTAMLPAQWSVARWQRDNQKKQPSVPRMVPPADGTLDQEKQSSAADDFKQRQQHDRRHGSATLEEPFVVRERRERAARRLQSAQTVTLGGGRLASDSRGGSGRGRSSRRGSVVMDIDEDDGASTTVQPYA